MKKIKIKTEYIKLDQFLKFTGVVSNGGEAKMLIIDGLAKVNGETELRRGRKLRLNDVIEFGGKEFVIVWGFILYISKIYLKNFRNYREQTISLNEKVNIIYGKNAQGKTNLLESIFLCSTGRSHRTSKDYELIKEGQHSYSVKIEGVRDDIPFNIGIYFEKDGRKNITKPKIFLNQS